MRGRRGQHLVVRNWLWLVFLLVGCSRPAPEPTKPIGHSANIEKAVSQAECRFSCELWRALPDTQKNLAISPPGLLYGLHLLASGAQGQTRAEILAALHSATPTLAESYRKYFEDIAPVLKWSQRLYARPGLALGAKFVEQGRLHYATEVLPLPDQAAMDEWVNRSTSGKIPSLAVDNLSDVSLLLVNCLYLKIDWKEPFEVKDTSPQEFHGAGWTHQVPTMRQRDELLYAQGDGYKVVQLPYKGNRFVFDCILPDRTDGLSDLERTLNWDKLSATLDKLESTSIKLSLPRFKIQARQDFEACLKTLGIRRAFGPEAEFSEINPKLWLNGVTQQTWLKVDEEGTQATAVTEMIMVTGTPGPAQEFRADHPFLFLLRDETTGLILFVGRVVDPAEPV